MADINTALDASKEAIEQLILAGERTRTAWTSPRAPGKVVAQPNRGARRPLARGVGQHGGWPSLKVSKASRQSFTPSSGACCSSGC